MLGRLAFIIADGPSEDGGVLHDRVMLERSIDRPAGGDGALCGLCPDFWAEFAVARPEW
jgi:hypothetical protein